LDSVDPIVESTFKTDSGDDRLPCIGLSQFQWMNKYVSLVNTEGIVVATSIVRASQQEGCVDSSPLKEIDVGVFILELNGDSCIPDDWRFFGRCWPVFQVLYERAGLFV
jgi:hypothetical protein